MALSKSSCTMALELFDVECAGDLQFNWNLKSLDGVHARVRWPALQVLLEGVQRRLGALRNYFNRSIGQIAREAAQAEPLGLAHDKPPEPHALHLSADQPPARGHGRPSPSP
jgi:hypothetical protein